MTVTFDLYVFKASLLVINPAQNLVLIFVYNTEQQLRVFFFLQR